MKPFEQRMKGRLKQELTRVNDLIAGFQLVEREETFEGADMLAELLERAAALEEALYRMGRGLFGKCMVCERGIDRDEIDASPEVALCLECQALLEKASPSEPRAGPRRSGGTPRCSGVSKDKVGAG